MCKIFYSIFVISTAFICPIYHIVHMYAFFVSLVQIPEKITDLG